MKKLILRQVLILHCLLWAGIISCGSNGSSPNSNNPPPGSGSSSGSGSGSDNSSSGSGTLPSLSINTNLSVAEGNSGLTPLVFTVTLSAPSNQAVTVDYATADGTATVADADYQASNGTLTFSPNQTTQTITVQVVGDAKFEPDETILVNLSNPTQATIAQGQGQGTITSDDCPDGYAFIPGGSFMLGSANGVGDDDEHPQKQVTMSSFCLGKTEISVGTYVKFLGGPLNFIKQEESKFSENKQGSNYPVVGMTFDEKRVFCKADGGDLPTAAQLHFASRFDVQDLTKAGQACCTATLADGDIKVTDLVIADNNFATTEPVDANGKTGGTRANRFGVYNLLGNVWESALDAYDSGFYAKMSSQDPYNPLADENNQTEEFTGGSFDDDEWYARPAFRGSLVPYGRVYDVGFRCARPLP